jgi:flotillin
MLGYRVPSPDQAMLISGGKQKTEGASFEVVIGHGKWIMPGFRKVRFLGLDIHKVDLDETCRSHEGIPLHLLAVAAFKVQSDVTSVNAAAQRFLGEQKHGQMEEMTKNIFAGHLRSIVGSMKVVDIHRDRDALAAEILRQSQLEMSQL